MIACSSSARNPIDSTRTVPDPNLRSSGTIFPARASTSPSMPRRRGTEKPQMSASRIPTTRPREASATARFTVTDDLPTPPLPDAMASTRVEAAIAVSGASSRAFQRARAITVARASASMAATCTSTVRTQSRDRTWFTTSRSIWLRSGQEAMVNATSTMTSPPSTATPRTMPRSTMVSPSSGSTTARRQSRTSSWRASRDGGPGVGVGAAGGVTAGNCTCVAGNSDPSPLGCSGPPGADSMGDVPWRTVHPGGRSPGVRRNEEEPVTTMSTSVNIGKKPAPVTLSDDAAVKVAQLLAEEEGEDLALRVAVKPGGCSGYSYEMFFDTEVMPDDVVREFGAVKVVVDSASAELLVGSTLDYSAGLQGAGFTIAHPNATPPRACGSSFS